MNKHIKYLTGAAVIVMALALAGYLYFTPLFIDRVYGTRRTIVICMLAGYAVFRSVRLYLNYQKEKRDERNLDI